MFPTDDEFRFHRSIESNDASAVRELLAEGVPVDCRTALSITPLMTAAMRGFTDLAEILIQGGARVNTRTRRSRIDEGSMTALHFAAEGGHVNTVAALLRHGANPNAATQSGDTALDYAAHAKSEAMVDLLLSHGANPDGSGKCHSTPLMSASVSHSLPILQRLLKAGADPNLKGTTGKFPLMMSPNPGFIKELLAHGASVDLKNADGRSALLVFIHHVMTPEVLRILISAGADVNAKDNDAQTALMLLTNNPQIELAEVLLEAGANVNAISPSGLSLLDGYLHDRGGSAGTRVRRRELIEHLRSHGAKTSAELAQT